MNYKIDDGNTVEDITEEQLEWFYMISNEKRTLDQIKEEMSRGKKVKLDGTCLTVSDDSEETEEQLSLWDIDAPWDLRGLDNLPRLEEPKCQHKNKYLNEISKSLKFMYCPDCKKEVT